MDFQDIIKKIRKLKKLRIIDMQIGKSRYAYSRIEKKETKITLIDLKHILNKFEMTPVELISFASNDSEFELYKKLLNECINQPKNRIKTNELLQRYYDPSNIDKKTKLERCYLVGIVGNFRGKLPEVHDLTSNELHLIVNTLINQSFYSEYDYLTAMNIISLVPIDMLDKIITSILPIKFYEERTQNITRYASLLLTNAISVSIYNMHYQKALEYIELLEKSFTPSENYYLTLNVMYHKNIALHFHLKDTLYIENARKVINLIYDIGDTSLADTFEDELNHLIENPKYYYKSNNYSVVTPRK